MYKTRLDVATAVLAAAIGGDLSFTDESGSVLLIADISRNKEKYVDFAVAMADALIERLGKVKT